MNQVQEVFKRYEKKYIVTQQKWERLLQGLSGKMTQDHFGRHTICNVYFDTRDYQLIRTSIEKPEYKEKLRLRSYGIPHKDEIVFIELKKKYDGIVYKRRVPIKLAEAEAYLYEGKYPHMDNQILKELDFAVQKYELIPSAYLSYERIAMYGNDDENLRVTFDEKIQCRQTTLELENGSYGVPLLTGEEVLMEIKIPGSMPVWMSRLLSELEIFPSSFSKYGEFYTNYIRNRRGGMQCA